MSRIRVLPLLLLLFTGTVVSESPGKAQAVVSITKLSAVLLEPRFDALTAIDPGDTDGTAFCLKVQADSAAFSVDVYSEDKRPTEQGETAGFSPYAGESATDCGDDPGLVVPGGTSSDVSLLLMVATE